MELNNGKNQLGLETAKSKGRKPVTCRIRTNSQPQSSHFLRGSEINTTSARQRRTKSCRQSELDGSLMNEQNREKLIQEFLPDIRRIHARMGYTQPARPFNLNQEKLKTVQIRAKTSPCLAGSVLREHSDYTLGSGAKAANCTTPRPAWDVKESHSFRGETRLLTVYVKRQDWRYKDSRTLLDRPLPKNTRDK